MNYVVFLTSFSECLSFLYRKVTEVCILILHPAILMNVFISCRNFLEDFFSVFCIYNHTICKWECFLYIIIPFANENVLTSLFSTSFPFSLSCFLLLWLRRKVLHWMWLERGDSIALFLTLVEILQIFST